MRGWLVFLLCLVAALFCGCGGNNVPYVPIGASTGGGGGGGTPDFSVAVNPNNYPPVDNPTYIVKKSVIVHHNWEEGQFMIVNVTSLNGFSGLVHLSAVGNGNANVFSTTLSPTQVEVSGGQTQSSEFTVSLDSELDPGDYTFTITATSGSISHTAIATVEVVDD